MPAETHLNIDSNAFIKKTKNDPESLGSLSCLEKFIQGERTEKSIFECRYACEKIFSQHLLHMDLKSFPRRNNV